VKVRNPRTGVADHEIAPLRPHEVTTVAAELRARQGVWAALAPAERAAVLEDWAERIGHGAGPLVAALERDTGRRGISKVEVNGVVALLRRWARQAPALIAREEAREIATSVPGIVARTRLQPYGLVGCISPWNFPLTLALIDAVPALAAGAAVLVKPSEVTPRFIAPLMATVPDALPLRLIEGDGETGAAMIGAVDYVCFTGSVATGRKVGEAAARAFVPASLELGGKDPMIVLASADPEAAAATALRASIVNSGQACQSIERIYVAQEIAAPFLAALVEKAKAVRLNAEHIGRGDIGPFIFARQAEIVAAQIADALARGARLHCGGTIEEIGGGLYLRPTVLDRVTPDMAVMQEETFGPVLPVTVFDSAEEAAHLANAGSFGLSAAVLAGTAEEAEAFAERLEAGAISINDGALTAFVWEVEKTSFGLSGLGPSRMGESGLLRFLRRKVLIRQSNAPLPIAAFSEEALGG
jgi:succinate-semialdehyde dehydrogenase / glutarate-semialdehyde dehydrogenase